MTKGRNIAKNSVYGAGAWLLPLVVGPIATPILVRHLGSEQFGIFALLTGFMTYSAVGLGRAATKYVAEYRAAGSVSSINNAVSAIFWISLAIGILSILIISGGAGFIVTNILRLPDPEFATARSGLVLVGITICVAVMSQIFLYILQAVHRFDAYLLLTSGLAAGLNVAAVALVLSGYGVVSILTATLILYATCLALAYIAVRRELPELRISLRIDPGHWSSTTKYAMSLVVYQVVGNVLFLAERTLIVRGLGADALTYYVVPMLVALYFHGFIGSCTFVLFPVANEIFEDKARLGRLYEFAMKLVLAAAVVFVVTTVVSGRALLELWMGPAFAEGSYGVLILHSLTFGLLGVATISWLLAEAGRAAWMNAAVTTLWAIVAISLMVAAVSRYGLVGIAASRLVGAAFFVPFIALVEHRFLPQVGAAFWIRNLAKAAAMALVAGVAEFAVVRSCETSWWALSVAILVGALSAAGMGLLTRMLNPRERASLRSLFRAGSAQVEAA